MNKTERFFTTQIYQVLLQNGFKDTYLYPVTKTNDQITVSMILPAHKDIEDAEELMLTMKETLKATDHKIKQYGKNVQITFGTTKLENICFSSSFINHNTLKLSLISSFGKVELDFSDGASCHLLNGGTTRMGKTSFLLYLATMMYIQTKGETEIHITSTKIKDYYPFMDVRNASLSKTTYDLLLTLDHLIEEYKQRDTLLNTRKLRWATDAKDVQKLYPEQCHQFKPIFLIIDEYARFSDNKEIQKKVQELVESAGYVNIHVIISTQRPDARTVLHPRIKANLLARICFTTADSNNSLIILDREGAEKLGKIQGRAILLDTDFSIVQVPYITPQQCDELLEPYRSEKDESNKESKQRSSDPESTVEIQNPISEPDSETDFFEQFQPRERNEPGHETIVNGWFRLAGATDKGSAVSVHSEPVTDPSQIK